MSKERQDTIESLSNQICESRDQLLDSGEQSQREALQRMSLTLAALSLAELASNSDMATGAAKSISDISMTIKNRMPIPNPLGMGKI